MTALSARGKAELRPPDLSVFSANSAEMEPLICAGCLLLLTLGSAVPGSVAAAAVERAVRPGDSVTLPCDVRHRLETLWFLQRSETLSLGKSASMISGPSGLTITGGLNPRLSAVWDPSSHSISLRIDNITEPDLALYYCADKEGATTRIGSGTRLVYEGNSNASSPTPRTNMTPSPAAPSPAPPRCLLPLWVTPVSAVLSALLASSCVYGLVRRAGKRGFLNTSESCYTHTYYQYKQGPETQETQKREASRAGEAKEECRRKMEA
ncbi:uncharacterized protein LOC136771311 isoform X2 [Amia ocellicauda]|uniref:uncharacterized protein LOC136771311 isoform X2 n=1 Tax=Amia ocellicauda TaxID=2972642 RepID=UPI0034644717